MAESSANTFHAMGKLDAAVETLMLVRVMGLVPAIRELANQVLAYDPQQFHAKWIVENIQEGEESK